MRWVANCRLHWGTALATALLSRYCWPIVRLPSLTHFQLYLATVAALQKKLYCSVSLAP
ncbi:unnamed protein product, partial [Nesidiocoris tenuis]